MNRASLLVGTALMAAAFAAAGLARAGERPVLHLYTWLDYFSPEALAAFEDRFGCQVAVDTFAANEDMLEELSAGDLDYDIITPSSYIVPKMRDAGLLLKIDAGLIPNLREVDAGGDWYDGIREHSVPYARTVTGVGYNAKRLDELGRSWSVFARPDLAGRLAMLDDCREALGAALKYLGHSLNTTDEGQIMAAAALLSEWKGNLDTFAVDEGIIGLGAGDYLAVQGYNGDVAVLMESTADIDFFVPREGSSISWDVFVIAASTAKAPLAHAFIDFILEAEMAAVNMEFTRYYMPHPRALALLDGELAGGDHAFAVPAETLEKCEVIRDLGPDTEKYDRAWATVRGE